MQLELLIKQNKYKNLNNVHKSDIERILLGEDQGSLLFMNNMNVLTLVVLDSGCDQPHARHYCHHHEKGHDSE